VTEASK